MKDLKLSLHQAALTCAAAGTLLYLNTLTADFCFDDLSAIKQNADLHPTTPWLTLLQNDFWGTPMHIEGSHKSYRPLCVATFRLNYMLHGLQPMGYHLVNVLLHAVVCYLYVQLCALVFTQVWPAFLAGLLFAVHPIHTEAVAGIVGRAELLASMLFLLTIMAYRKCLVAMHTEGKDAYKQGGLWLSVTLFLCLLSVFCKEQGITVIAVCLTYDLFIFHQHTLQSAIKTVSTGGLWPRGFIIRVLILAAFTLGVMFLRLQIMSTTLPVFTIHDNPAVAFPSPYRQLHWLYLISVNLWLLLSPSFLCADWTMGTVPPTTSLLDPRHLATVLSFLALFTLAIFSLTLSSKRAKAVLLALSLLVFPFLPASNLLFPVGFVVAERVLYLPSMGFCMLVALGLWLLLQNVNKTVLLVLLVSLSLASHSLKTVTRNEDWKTDNSLFKAAIRINPGNGKIYNNLGHDYENSGNFTFAQKLFHRATRIQPDDIGAFINLGRTLKQLGKYQEAEMAYLEAIQMMPKGKSFRIAPNHINVYYNLANLVKLDPERQEEAFGLYQKAISMKPNFVEAHMNKGDLLLRLNQTEEAKAAFETALYHNPDYTDAHYNLGSALLKLGKTAEAEQSYRQALALDYNHLHALLGLAVLLQENGNTDESLELFQRTLKLDPSNMRAYFYLALLYLDLQDLKQSEAMFLRALSIDPTYRSALYNIAVLYNHQKKVPEAIHYLQQLVATYPQHLNGAQLLADCYMRIADMAKAEQAYHHVLQNSPNHVPALHNLGVLKAETRQYEAAITLFSKALDIEPSHTPSRQHLQQAQQQLNNHTRT